MHKWIAGSTCAAAALSMAVVSAQTYPQTPDNQPTTKSTPSSGQTDTTRRGTTGRASSTSSTPQRVTATGCLMRGTGTRTESWILSKATLANNTASASGRVSENSGAANESTAGTSRSGSPSNEGTSAANRDEPATPAVSGSTSTAVGTSGTRNPSASVDTEAHGGGTLGATDQNGGTVGAGATAAVTEESPSAATGDQSSQNTGRTRTYNGEPSTQNRDASTSASSGVSYQLMGVRNPTQYMNKRVEVIGMMSNAGNSGNQMLRVTSVRVLGDTCQ